MLHLNYLSHSTDKNEDFIIILMGGSKLPFGNTKSAKYRLSVDKSADASMFDKFSYNIPEEDVEKQEFIIPEGDHKDESRTLNWVKKNARITCVPA